MLYSGFLSRLSFMTAASKLGTHDAEYPFIPLSKSLALEFGLHWLEYQTVKFQFHFGILKLQFNLVSQGAHIDLAEAYITATHGWSFSIAPKASSSTVKLKKRNHQINTHLHIRRPFLISPELYILAKTPARPRSMLYKLSFLDEIQGTKASIWQLHVI